MAYISCENDDRLWAYLDNFIANSRNRPWFFSFVQRNALSIQALIENDMFGELSDFDEENPAPAVLDQVKIVRAFLDNATFENYDINAIAGPLRNFINNIPEQAANLDNTLLIAQFHREEAWTTTLHNGQSYLNMLARYQILNQMERMLDSIEANNAAINDINELREWAEARRQEMLNLAFTFNQAYENFRYTFLGGAQLSQFVRNEFLRLKSIVTNAWTTIVGIAHSPTSLETLIFALGTSMLNIIVVGLTFLLPMRLLLTLCRQGARWVGSFFNFIGGFFPDRFREFFLAAEFITYLGLMASAINYFDISWKMILGFQFFPATWTWGFIGTLVAGTFSAMYVAGLGLWALNALGLITLPPPSELLTWLVPAANQPEEQVAPAPSPNPTQQAEPTTDPILLNPQQRTRLTMLLMQRRSVVSNDGTLEPEKKKKKQKKIEGELQGLRQTATPYYLSNMDRKIIRARDPMPTEFENLNLDLPTP